MKKIVFIINHPIDIVFALSIIKELNLVESEFLVFEHKYFNGDIYDFIKRSKIDFKILDKPEYLKNIYLGFKKGIKFINQLKKTINNNSLIITFSKFELYIDLLNKHFKNHISILQPGSTFNDFNKNELEVFHTYKIRRNIYEFLFNLTRTNPYRLKSTKSIVLFDKLSKNTEIFLSNNKNRNSNEITFPFSIKEEKLKHPNTIVVFGSRFLEWEYFDSKKIDILNDFLENLKSSFPEFKFIYVKHPLENREYEFLNINEFEIIENSINAEMIFYEMGHKIHSVYSIGSTSSKTAFEFGIKSHVLYKSLEFENSVEKVYNRIFNGYPKNFFIVNNEIKSYTTTKKMDLKNLEVLL